MKSRSPRKKADFATQSTNTMFQICEDVEAVGFPLQNVYKMTYGNEGATFEPLNPEPVNGYYLSNNVPVVNHLNQFPECIHFLQEIQIVNHF